MARKKADTREKERRDKEDVCRATADIIRRMSEAGLLISLPEILLELTGQGLLRASPPEMPSTMEPLVRETLEGNQDLKELLGHDGISRYYSDRFLSATYARILLGKQGNPLLLIAGIVRENSLLYPRPIPLETFQDSPFGMAREEILAHLQQMAGEDEFKDIAQTITSAGSLFLYSTLHLDPGHASMLAEWFDVGQYDNP